MIDGRAELLEIRDADGATLAWWDRSQMMRIMVDLNNRLEYGFAPPTEDFIARLNALLG